MLGKIEGRRRTWQRMRWLDGITNSMNMSLSKPGSWWWTGKPAVVQSMGLQNWTQLSNWTELIIDLYLYVSFRLLISYLSTVISYFNTLRRQSIFLLTLVENVQVGCLKFFSSPCMSIKYYKSMTIIDVGVYKYILVSRWICRCGIHE